VSRLFLLLLTAGALALALHKIGQRRTRTRAYDRRIRELRKRVGKETGGQSINTTESEHYLREIAVLKKRRAMELRSPYLRRDVRAYLARLREVSDTQALKLREAAAAHPAEHAFEGTRDEMVEHLAQDYLDLVGIYEVDAWQRSEAIDKGAEPVLKELLAGDGSIAQVPKPRATLWLEVHRLPEDRYIRFIREVRGRDL